MGLQINTNVAALNSYRNLTGTQSSMQTSLERLSSGLRINRAADDAAGLAISEKLRSQVNGLNQAQANAQDGVSLIQTAEGALNEVHSMLQRMRTLSVQAASDTNTDADRAAIQKEVKNLVDEIDSTTGRTEFNGMKLIDGSFTDKQLQIGANTNQALGVSITGMTAKDLGLTATQAVDGKGAAGTNAITADAASKALTRTATYTVSGTDVLRDGAKVGTYTKVADGTAAAKVDFIAGEQGAGAVSVSFTDTAAATGEVSSFTTTKAVKVGDPIDLSSRDGALSALKQIDAAIGKVSDQRADLGALQNRLDHTIKNLGVSSENLAASESRIRDTDMAKEMTNFTRSQILQQAGVSMLAQANQSSQGVLKLLG